MSIKPEIKNYPFRVTLKDGKILNCIIVEARSVHNGNHSIAGRTQNVFVIFDRSDSINCSNDDIREMVNRVIRHFSSTRTNFNVFWMGNSKPVFPKNVHLSRSSSNVELKTEQVLNDKDVYKNRGTFIKATLDGIRTMRQRKPTTVLIFSDGEIWDWEYYGTFVGELNKKDKVVFIQIDGNNCSSTILEEIYNININNKNKVKSLKGNVSRQDLNENTQNVPEQTPLSQELSFKILFKDKENDGDMEPLCILNMNDMANPVQMDEKGFDFQLGAGNAPIMRRCFIFPYMPKKMKIIPKIVSAQDNKPVIKEWSYNVSLKKKADTKTLESYQKVAVYIKGNPSMFQKWCWNEEMINLLRNYASTKETIGLEHSIKCITCQSERTLFEWIAKNLAKCFCTQMLLLKGKCLINDKIFEGSKGLLIKINQRSNNNFKVEEEPILLRNGYNVENMIFTYDINWGLQVTAGSVRKYGPKSQNNLIRYYEQKYSKRDNDIQLHCYDFLRPIRAKININDPWYLFLDIKREV